MADDKETKMEESGLSTHSSDSPSLTEKEFDGGQQLHEVEEPTRDLVEEPPAPESTAVKQEPTELHKVTSAKDAAEVELTRIMTSGDGVEYPTGAKLQLICLALCLSVFLMALVLALPLTRLF
jgi:hypothetical protein